MQTKSNKMCIGCTIRAKVNVCNTTLVGLRGLKITALEVVRDHKLTSMDVRFIKIS